MDCMAPLHQLRTGGAKYHFYLQRPLSLLFLVNRHFSTGICSPASKSILSTINGILGNEIITFKGENDDVIHGRHEYNHWSEGAMNCQKGAIFGREGAIVIGKGVDTG